MTIRAIFWSIHAIGVICDRKADDNIIVKMNIYAMDGICDQRKDLLFTDAFFIWRMDMSVGFVNAVSIERGYDVKKGKNADGSSQADKVFADYLENGKVSHLTGKRGVVADKSAELPNRYFIGEKNGFVEYNRVSFRCNYLSGALELGDTSNPMQCIRVPLEGGSLLFHPDSMGGVSKAIGMFSAEDQGRIMRAIQIYNMAKKKMEELEEDENAAPETAETDGSVSENGEGSLTDSVDSERKDLAGIADNDTYVAVLKEESSKYHIYDVVEKK